MSATDSLRHMSLSQLNDLAAIAAINAVHEAALGNQAASGSWREALIKFTDEIQRRKALAESKAASK